MVLVGGGGLWFPQHFVGFLVGGGKRARKGVFFFPILLGGWWLGAVGGGGIFFFTLGVLWLVEELGGVVFFVV